MEGNLMTRIFSAVFLALLLLAATPAHAAYNTPAAIPPNVSQYYKTAEISYSDFTTSALSFIGTYELDLTTEPNQMITGFVIQFTQTFDGSGGFSNIVLNANLNNEATFYTAANVYSISAPRFIPVDATAPSTAIAPSGGTNTMYLTLTGTGSFFSNVNQGKLIVYYQVTTLP